MEIIATSPSTIKSMTNCSKLVQFHGSSLHCQAPATPTSLRFPVISRSVCALRKSRTATCSLAGDTTSNAATKVVAGDPSLAVKKRAADISPELKETFIFLVAASGESAAKVFWENDEKRYQETETEVLKQLSSMGQLVVCAGNGAVKSSTNLALLRHGISIWIDVPLDMVARADLSELPSSELSALYKEMRDGYATADAIVSLQRVASQLGYDDFDGVTTEDMTKEVLKDIEKLIGVKKMMEETARPF